MSGPAFHGLTVLITGAAGGLGARMAQDFATQKANLVLIDRDDDRLKALAQQLAQSGAGIETISGDCGDEAMAERMVETALARFGTLDVAINNAGIAPGYVPLSQTATADAEAMLRLNVMGVFYAMKHEIPAMQAQFKTTGRKGAIVNMASAAGTGAAPMMAFYSATKHAVVGLTRSAAVECARQGLRINAVCPAFTRTPMLDAVGSYQRRGVPMQPEDLAQAIPMRRLAEPCEVSAAVLFAADPANSFMTGQTIGIDGGLTA